MHTYCTSYPTWPHRTTGIGTYCIPYTTLPDILVYPPVQHVLHVSYPVDQYRTYTWHGILLLGCSTAHPIHLYAYMSRVLTTDTMHSMWCSTDTAYSSTYTGTPHTYTYQQYMHTMLLPARLQGVCLQCIEICILPVLHHVLCTSHHLHM